MREAKANKIKDTMVRWLNHYRYGREITGLIQSLMIGIIFLEQFEINRYLYFIIIPVTGFGFLYIGYFLRKKKVFERDLGYRTKENPFMQDLLTKVNYIHDEIKKTEDPTTPDSQIGKR